MQLSELIKSIKFSKRLKITCPHCDARFSASKVDLFTEDALSKGALEFKQSKVEEIAELKKELHNIRVLKPERVKRGAMSSNLGKILEKFTPILPGFNHKPEESVPLFDPIDFIAFNGLSKNNIASITFMDVKSGNARLLPKQKSIRDIIEAGKISVDIIKGTHK